jgi:hypothetical protein
MDPRRNDPHRNIYLTANRVVLLLAICFLSLQALAQQASPTPVRTPSQVDPDVVKIQYGFEVYNAKLDAARKPSLQSRIRVFRDGNLVLDGQPIPVDLTGQADMKRLQTSGALNLLKEMQPGDYILQVIVTDSLAKKKEQVTAQHIQFEVVQ